MIRRVPQNLFDAIGDFEEDGLMKEVLGEGAYEKYLKGKNMNGRIIPPVCMNGS